MIARARRRAIPAALYLSPERLAREDTIEWLSACRFLFSPSTKRTAFPNGGTNSGRSTGS